MMHQKPILLYGILIKEPVNALNDGMASCTKYKPSKNDKNVIKTDSNKNWQIRSLRCEPITLRTPTSLARFSDLAVERFMKLIQAIANTSMPIILNKRTYSTKPPTALPFLKSVIKCQSFKG